MVEFGDLGIDLPPLPYDLHPKAGQRKFPAAKEDEEKEKGAGNGNEQDTVSPDMRILSMILKMDLMVMISKMATFHRKKETVSRDVRILLMILDLMVMTIKMATQ